MQKKNQVIAGKVTQARNLIMQGCEATPLNEDIWLEAARCIIMSLCK
jgi:hypothetical protein